MNTNKSDYTKMKDGSIKVAMYCRVGRAEQVDEKERRIEKYSRALQKCSQAKFVFSEYVRRKCEVKKLLQEGVEM